MVRERMYGSDTEFCAWMRSCPQLPSYSADFGFVASDNDVTVHRYLQDVDSIGTRDVQGLMQIEVKTRRGYPKPSQMDTLSKLNLFCGEKTINGQHIKFFGVFVLSLSGMCPDTSEHMWWGAIPKGVHISEAKGMTARLITKEQLIKLLRFEIHPRTFDSRAFGRHHVSYEVMELVKFPLGIECLKPIIHRS